MTFFLYRNCFFSSDFVGFIFFSKSLALFAQTKAIDEHKHKHALFHTRAHAHSAALHRCKFAVLIHRDEANDFRLLSLLMLC